MKKIIPILLLLICSTFTKAQYVTIPDANFRSYLLNQVPNCFNADTLLDTTCTGLSTVTSIFLIAYDNGGGIDIDGVQYFKSLQSFQATLCDNVYNVSELPNSVTSITFQESSPINWTRYPPNLHYLMILAGGTNDILLPLPESLTEFDFVNSFYASSLPPLPSKLQVFQCENNALTSLPSLPATLQSLDCSNNPPLQCLPKLPAGLTTLNIDTGIDCLPNYVAGLSISVDGQSTASFPVCSSSYNPGGCSIYKSCTWKGNTSTQWEDSTNWDCGFVPDQYTDVFINIGTVVIHSNAFAKSLNVATGAQVTVDSTYKVTITN